MRSIPLVVCALWGAVACSPEVVWLATPGGAASVLIASDEAPVRAQTVESTVGMTFGDDTNVEVAFYSEDLGSLGLTAGDIPIREDGVALRAPDAIYRRAAGGDWAQSSELGVRLASVRIAEPGLEQCRTFEVTESSFEAVGTRFVMPAGEDKLIIGDSQSHVFVLDAADFIPREIEITRSDNGPIPFLKTARHVGGAHPYLLGASDGSIWRGSYVEQPPRLAIEWIATSSTGQMVRWIDGTTDPVDVHVLLGAGENPQPTVRWDRFDGTTWRSVGTLPQFERGTHYDVLYVGPNDVYATVQTSIPTVLHYDGQAVTAENAPSLASLILLDDRIFGGSYDELFERVDGIWTSVYRITNEAFVDEPPFVVMPYDDGLLMFGNSFAVQTVPNVRCPTTYIWPSQRFLFAEPLGDVIVLGAFSVTNASSLVFVRAQ